MKAKPENKIDTTPGTGEEKRPYQLYCANRLRVICSRFVTDSEARRVNVHFIKDKCGHLKFILPERFTGENKDQTPDADGAGSLPSTRCYKIKR